MSVIDWFYNSFGTFEDVEEVYLDAEGNEVRRWVRTFTSDPAWWLIIGILTVAAFVFTATGALPLVTGILLSLYNKGWVPWPLYTWSLFGVFLAIGIYCYFRLKSFLQVNTIQVRQDQKCDRQMFGGGRYFRNCPILTTQKAKLAFFTGNQQKVQSSQKPGDKFSLTSFVMQKKVPRTKLMKDMTREERLEYLNSTADIPRHEQFFIIEVVYYLGVWTLPRLLSEKFFTAFHRRWLDRHKENESDRYNAMKTDVESKVLEISVGAADGIIQDFSAPELNSDVKEASEELTRHLLMPLRRMGVELVQVIIVKMEDMPGEAGYQTTTQASIRARLKGKKERIEAVADRQTREKRAAENETAAKAEQEARARIAEAEASALVQVIAAEKRRQELANQAIIERMRAVADKQGELALAKLQEMSPEQISAVIMEIARNINPNLQGTTLASVEGLGDFLKNLPSYQLVEGLMQLFRKEAPGAPPTPPPST